MKYPSINGKMLVSATLLSLACSPDSTGFPSEPAETALLRSEDEPSRYGEWSAPINLGPVVNSPEVDLELSISRDGRSLFIASNRSGDFDIWVAQRSSDNHPWEQPQSVGSTINTSAREQGPFVSIDGHRLYFFSDREGGFGGTDLYVSRRRDQRDDFGWQEPVNLGSGVNSAANETLPVIFADDATGVTTLYFTSSQGGAGGDIYSSTLQPDETFGPAVLIEELSSPRRDRVLAIRRDGLELFLASDRPGPAQVPFDLWVATRTSTSKPWSNPEKLGIDVNGAADEGSAALSFDGTALYLASNRSGSLGAQDTWVSTRSRR